MAKLNDEVRADIVMALAQFETPGEIRDRLREERGLDVPITQIWHYNPDRKDVNATDGGSLAQKWRELYKQTRSKFLARTQDIGIANKAFRLQRLDRMARKAERMRNYKLAAELHEQAAKEMGGYFTNTSNVNVNARAALAQLIGVAVDALPADRDRRVERAEELRALAAGNGSGSSTNGGRNVGEQ